MRAAGAAPVAQQLGTLLEVDKYRGKRIQWDQVLISFLKIFMKLHALQSTIMMASDLLLLRTLHMHAL